VRTREYAMQRIGARLVRAGLIVGLIGMLVPVAPRPVRADGPFDQIGHVIVIYQENHAFDTYLASFPGADGLANAGATMTQVDKQGRPYATLPQPLARPEVGTTVRLPDPRFPADLPNR